MPPTGDLHSVSIHPSIHLSIRLHRDRGMFSTFFGFNSRSQWDGSHAPICSGYCLRPCVYLASPPVTSHIPSATCPSPLTHQMLSMRHRWSPTREPVSGNFGKLSNCSPSRSVRDLLRTYARIVDGKPPDGTRRELIP